MPLARVEIVELWKQPMTVGRDHRYPPSVASRESGGYRGARRMKKPSRGARL